MSDFYEIDFIKIDNDSNADAIAIRYSIDGQTKIHVVDAGFSDTGDSIVEHIKEFYGNPTKIDNLVLTHPDQDHIGGMSKVIEAFDIENLWMNLPWLYADELIKKSKYTNKENFINRLKETYKPLADLEDLAISKNIKVHATFQNEKIGEFTVMSPTKDNYIDLITRSNNFLEEEATFKKLGQLKDKICSLISALWGEETFPTEGTSPENETSVVQFAELCGKKILLTGDAGREALENTIKYAGENFIDLSGLDVFQIPHHGSRRNVSTEILNELLGKIKSSENNGQTGFSAIASISSKTAKEKGYPRKSVVRAMIHRGGRVVTNNESTLRSSKNAPNRNGWSAVDPLLYPEEEEEI